jgi:hypothetical protein
MRNCPPVLQWLSFNWDIGLSVLQGGKVVEVAEKAMV